MVSNLDEYYQDLAATRMGRRWSLPKARQHRFKKCCNSFCTFLTTLSAALFDIIDYSMVQFINSLKHYTHISIASMDFSLDGADLWLPSSLIIGRFLWIIKQIHWWWPSSSSIELMYGCLLNNPSTQCAPTEIKAWLASSIFTTIFNAYGVSLALVTM